MSDELIARVTGVIAKTQHLPPETVTIDSTFEELKIDSLDGINILFALESEFDIDIPDDAARQIESIREMVGGSRETARRQRLQRNNAPARCRHWNRRDFRHRQIARGVLGLDCVQGDPESGR